MCNVPIGLLIGSNRLVVWVGGIILYVGIKVRFLVLVLNPQASRAQELWLGEGQVGRQGLGWVTGLEFSYRISANKYRILNCLINILKY